MIEKIATGYAAKALFDKLRGPEDKTAEGSKTELRDGKNVGMEGGIENHSFDLSTRDALNLMNQRKAEGKPVTGDDMKAVIKSLADSGQITREEWMDLREYVTANYDNLSPEAKAAYDKLDTAIQGAGGKVGWFDGARDGATRADSVVKGPELKTLLEQIDGKKAEAGKDTVEPSGGHGPSSAGGGGTGSGSVKEPSSGPASGSSGAGRTGGPSANAGWGEIIAYLMGLIDEKEKKLKQMALDTSKQIDGLGETTKKNDDGSTTTTGGTNAAGEGKESLNTKLADIQDQMKKLDQLTEMMTNLLNSTHQTTSKVIGNIR